MQTLLVLGDWSRDGHGITETIVVDHNLADAKTLKQAFVAGENILGISFHDIADNFEEPWIPQETLDVLIKHNLLKEVTTNSAGEPLDGPHYALVPESPIRADYAYEYDGNININSELFAALWMAVAQLGKPSLTYTVPKRTNDNRINIGGYGLFNM